MLAEAGDRLRDRSILPDGDLMLRIDKAAERLSQMRDDTQIDPGPGREGELRPRGDLCGVREARARRAHR